ncbi:MAG TPA: GatB/YqeY domain-containing protein, partial [Tepidisphaeraceae bacterium]|nr:GatB/YqeY domain-containing protein [Tepidisphaeraceae bacterium]
GKTAEVEQLKAELVIVQEYLPKKASTEDTAKLVDEFLAKNNFTEKQIGQAMGAFMKAHGQQVDPGAANQLIKQKLSGK